MHVEVLDYRPLMQERDLPVTAHRSPTPTPAPMPVIAGAVDPSADGWRVPSTREEIMAEVDRLRARWSGGAPSAELRSTSSLQVAMMARDNSSFVAATTRPS